MKRLITMFIILLLCLFGWYFFLPAAWLEPIVDASAPEKKPAVVIPAGLFTSGPDVLNATGSIVSTTRIGDLIWATANARITDCGKGTNSMQLGDGAEVGPVVEFYDSLARYGYYQNDTSKNYGVLYTHAAVRTCDLCPAGFRVTTKADWENLFTALGTAADRGKLLLKRHGSPFAAGFGGRVDAYGPVLAGRFEFYWAGDLAPEQGYMKMAWGPEIRNNGEVQIRPQDVRTACYVRCVRDANREE